MLITTFVILCYKDRRGGVNVKLWFLMVCVRCEVLCRLVVADNVFLLILIVVILYATPSIFIERNDHCGNQHYSRELLMMGIVVPETCWAYKKYSKIISGWSFSLQPGHYSSLTAPNLQPTVNQEGNDQCGNQHYSRELLMIGIVMPETCSAYKKDNKIISGIVGFHSSVITMMHGPKNIKYNMRTCTKPMLNILIVNCITVKPVKLTTFIRWPPADVDHISVEPAKSYIVCMYDHLRNFSTFICWIPVYVSHAKWNRGTVYTCLYWPW